VTPVVVVRGEIVGAGKIVRAAVLAEHLFATQ